uniref:Uncharacterized protein n=1 Tax=Leersia perrieri TaxID=77586 RepID=A0A0D9UXM1_9ORYZ
MAGASPSARAEVVVPSDWAAATAAVSSETAPPVVIVCGPKNAGKSTFSRLLLNSLLPRYGRVGYLDTDVGQPEFSPPGCLSFNFVEEALTETYLNCLFHLYDYFVEKYRSGASEPLPLIVNTPGWVKGAGFDMLVEMLRYICPTIVVQIRISVQSKNLPDGMFWLDCGQTGPKMINIDAPFHDALNRSLLIQKDSYGMRERRLIEYFKQCFANDISLATNKELAYALTSLPPYEVSISDVMVIHLHCQVPPSEVWHSLNATIVGLAISCGTAEAGIVRGVDVQRGILYVITPIPLEHLQSVDLLLQGLIEIPKSLLQVRGCVSPYMPTNVLHRISERDINT